MSKYLTYDDFVVETKEKMGKAWTEIEMHSDIISDIVSARIEKNISQEKLAEYTGLKQSAIARFENCKGYPRLDTVLKILAALDLQIKIEQDDEERSSRTYNKIVPLHRERYSLNSTYKYENRKASTLVAQTEGCI